jgi:hypothetical protein
MTSFPGTQEGFGGQIFCIRLRATREPVNVSEYGQAVLLVQNPKLFGTGDGGITIVKQFHTVSRTRVFHYENV